MTRYLPRRDSVSAGFALLTATRMIAQQVAGKATRDALFLSHFDVTDLPKVVVAAALLSLAAVFTMSSLLARLGPVPLVPVAFMVSAALLAGEWLLLDLAPAAAAVALYLHIAVFGAVLISGFWSVVNERFDAQSAKRRVAEIAAAATLGGVVGGVVSSRVAAALDIRAMMLVLSILHLLCAGGLRMVAISQRTASAPEAEVRSGIALIARTPFLQQMALLTALAALGAALLDYALKAEASARYASSEALITFFGTFYAAVGVLTFVLQSLLGPRLLRRLGLAGTISILPGAVLVGGIVATAFSHLWTVVLLRAGESMVANSLFRSAFELLYTPLRPDLKRPTKTIIDVASNRLGDIAGGGLLLVLLFIVPDLPASLVVTLAMAVAGIVLIVVNRLHHGYVGQLTESLRAGAMRFADEDALDATTRRMLTALRLDNERELLRAKLAALQQAAPGGSPAIEAAGEHDQLLLTAIADLRSGQVERIRSALSGRCMEPSLVPHLIPLLAHPAVGDDVKMELRWMVPRIVGQLGDALIDPDTPLAVRQRIPTVLEVCHTPRAIEALVGGLGDSEFSVRYKCARVLERMTARSRDLQVRADDAWAAVRRELEADDAAWAQQELPAEVAQRAEEDVATAREGIMNPSLQHVFTLLGLALDREAVSLALQAIAGSDRGLRGTALEYLENVLPDDIRRMLWPRVGVTSRRRQASGRTREQIVDALVQSSDLLKGPGR